jgi:tetratricopeptide (TPR) repeat protein
MLKPRKRITKKELKQDRLVTTYVKTTEFLRNNRKVVSSSATALVIAVIVIIAYLNNRNSDNLKATTELSQVINLFNGGAYQTAINGDPTRDITGLKSIVDNYGGSEAGERAKIYLADCYYYLGDYNNALKYFKDYDGSDKLLEASADAGVAEIYEIRGDYQKSADYYDRAASRDPKNFLTPQYLIGAARSYIKIGKRDRAIELLDRVKKNFADSPYASNLDYYMAEAKVE